MGRQDLQDNSIKMIHLACTRGNLGYWDYYSTVMKIEDIVNNNRVITVSESEELYTNNINEILQREIKESRIKSLKNYITDDGDRFLGSLVLAIHKGAPRWTDIDINRTFEIDGSMIDDSSLDFLNSKFGVLSLNGDEQIFALDGQHRLLGLRKAYSEKPEIGELDVPVIFVIHNHNNLERTRRLFTVLNKYAEKPQGAELIILDEDDAAAIISRKLVTHHEVLSKPNGISNSKSGTMPTNDNSSFTTLVTINTINKILFSKPNSYYTSRPSDLELDRLYSEAKLFWDSLFECFPELVMYIEGNINVQINNISINRNHESGGSLLLRPVGQKLLSQAYKAFSDSELQTFKDKIRQVDFNLSSNIWKYLFWNEKMLTGEDKLKKNLLLFMLGKYANEENVHEEMRRVYELNNMTYANHINKIN